MTTEAQAVAHIVGANWPVTSGTSTVIQGGDTLSFTSDGTNNITSMVHKRNTTTIATYTTVSNSQNYMDSSKLLGIGFQDGGNVRYFNFNFDVQAISDSTFISTAYLFEIFVDLSASVVRPFSPPGDNPGGGPGV